MVQNLEALIYAVALELDSLHGEALSDLDFADAVDAEAARRVFDLR